MKKSIFLALACMMAAVSTLRAQYVPIPDAAFGYWLYNNGYSSCLTGNNTSGWQLDTACTGVTGADSMYINTSTIADLTGLRYFKHLNYFGIVNNPLTNIPALPPALANLSIDNAPALAVLPSLPTGLTRLYLTQNALSSLPSLPSGLIELTFRGSALNGFPALPSTLTTLYVSSPRLHALPALPASLLHFSVSSSPLYTLPTLPSSLLDLGCYQDSLTSLPALPATLTTIHCEYNQLTSLPALPAALLSITAGHNLLTTLPTLPAALAGIDCSFNPITTLPAMPSALLDLNCSYTSLTALPVLPAQLNQLNCSYSPITTLPAMPTRLYTLHAEHCALTSIATLLTDTLQELYISYNQLTTLPNIPIRLQSLYCDHNQITSLPFMSQYLAIVQADHNQLTSLTNVNAGLNALIISVNPNLHCLPTLPASMYGIGFDSTAITCLPNRVAVNNIVDRDPSTVPLCDASSGCDFAYSISGNVHYDTAGTCLDDSLAPGSPVTNMKVLLKSGGTVIQQYYTMNAGEYSFKAPSLSGYTVEIDTTGLLVSVVCPTSGVRTVSLTTSDSLARDQDFAMICTPNRSDYGIQYVYASRFRPATTTTVLLSAGNTAMLRYHSPCGAGASGVLTVTYTGAVQYAGSVPGTLTPVVSGNVLTYTIADLDSLTSSSLGFLLTTDSFATAGTDVCISGTLTTSTQDIDTSNNNFNSCYNIVNSYDPNHKNVSPDSQVDGGDWLTYTIQFQNTGSDTAYYIEVRDTLSSYVDPASFQYLASSHQASVKLVGSAISFAFAHIDLVDSATNPKLSEGWIQYKVRTKTSLPRNSEVRNTAYIYFDLNPAVVTNTAISSSLTTGITDVQPLTQIQLYPNPNAGTFTLRTSGGVHGQYTITDMMGAVAAQHTIASDMEEVNMHSAAAGVYTLTVKGTQGSSAMKFVVVR